jgi:PTH1 family peptidyl-tRNA hydrolase
MIVDHLADRIAADQPRDRMRSFIREARRGDQRVVLVKPQTYMNLSGSAVQQVVNWYKVGPADLVIVYDDMDLPFGELRFRESGSAGGHNGMASTIEALGRTTIPRLRVGIGRSRNAATGHVLSTFTAEEQSHLPNLLSQAADGLETWLDRGPIAAMNDINSRRDATTNGSPATGTTSSAKRSQGTVPRGH